jgi:FkbH-like protein
MTQELNRDSSTMDLEGFLLKQNLENLPKIEIAVLRNISAEFIETHLRFQMLKRGLNGILKFGGFGEFFKEAVEGAPTLISEETRVVWIFTPIAQISNALAYEFQSLSPETLEDEINRLKLMFEGVITGLRQQTSAMILWNGMELPLYPELGIADPQKSFGQFDAIAKVNSDLRNALACSQNAYFVDADRCLARIGQNSFYDTRTNYLTGNPYARAGLSELAAEALKFIVAGDGRAKKCLVLDCDNTIWGGIVGEDGLSKISLGNTYPGSAFLDFQRTVVSLQKRGVIVAINSKNNLSDVMEVFRDHPEMILREEHVSAWRVNWEDKAANMRSLSAELNIGLDSMVFLDDSPFEIELVQQQLPMVSSIALNKSAPATYADKLASSALFDLPKFTSEDAIRSKLYREEKSRIEERALATDLESYYKSLQIQITIGGADSSTIPRIAQQTQKTNQFNLTTRRYSELDIEKFVKSANSDVFWLRAADKYGDMGVIGTCILTYSNVTAVIDTLLMSCRGLGRNIETQFIDEVCRLAHQRGARTIEGLFIPTTKNMQTSDFFSKNGFTKALKKHVILKQWKF